MLLLTVTNLHFAYGSDIVLDGATFAIEQGEKAGLVGRNGSGKTTLMRAILGDVEPQQGAIQKQKTARIGYLSQDPDFDPEDTVRDAAERAFATLHELHVQINHVFEKMATAEGEALERFLKKQARLEAAIEAEGGYAIDHRIDATLHGLGFSDEQFSQSVTTLSGGQKNRLCLARLLLEAPDLLLLDEPTNHLDITGREWLETFLAEEYSGTVLVVSHDRYLLDRVVSRIIEVERGMIREYPGNYHKYLDLRRERQETQHRVYEKQLGRIRSEEQFIAKYKAGQRAKQARGRLARLERFKRDELVERPAELDVMRLNLPRPARSGDIAISAEHISKRYDDLVLFDDLSLTLSRGDRIGVIGPNGIGKTTLVKCLLGEIEPDSGTVRLGSRVSVGYYRQTHEHVDRSLTVWQYLQRTLSAETPGASATAVSEQQARDLAGAFLFSGDEQDKTLAEISGGERSRAVIAGLVGGAHNLLVLDEPTNHLDIPSAERLEQALARAGGFTGSIVLISHDRALLDAVCDRLLIFDPPGAGESDQPGEGQVREFLGNYSKWAEKRREIDAQQVGQRAAERRSAERTAKSQAARRAKSIDNQQKQRSNDEGAQAARLNRMSLAKIETRIEEIETRTREIDQLMIDPDVYRDGSRMKALQEERAALAAELEPLEFEWAARAEG